MPSTNMPLQTRRASHLDFEGRKIVWVRECDLCHTSSIQIRNICHMVNVNQQGEHPQDEGKGVLLENEGKISEDPRIFNVHRTPVRHRVTCSAFAAQEVD